MKGHGETLNHIIKWKKPIWKGRILPDPHYMISKGKAVDTTKISVVARGSSRGLSQGRDEQAENRIFRVVGIFYIY